MGTVPEALHLLSYGMMRQGAYADAAAVLRKELSSNPYNARALRNLGVYCYEMELLDQAEECFRRAVDLEPESAKGWNNLAAILLERGDPGAAAPLFEEARKRDPEYAEACSNRLMCKQYIPGATPERLLALSI